MDNEYLPTHQRPNSAPEEIFPLYVKWEMLQAWRDRMSNLREKFALKFGLCVDGSGWGDDSSTTWVCGFIMYDPPQDKDKQLLQDEMEDWLREKLDFQNWLKLEVSEWVEDEDDDDFA